jgi:magnesium transporter
MNLHTRLGLAFADAHPAEAAAVLQKLPVEKAAPLLLSLQPQAMERLLEQLPADFAAECLLTLDQAAACRLLVSLDLELQVRVLRRLDAGQRDGLLGDLNPELAATLRRILRYPDDTAGAVMEAPLASVPDDISVREALKRVRRVRRGLKFYVYVVNSQEQLIGVVTLHELLNASASRAVADIMVRKVVSLPAGEAMPVVAESPYWRKYNALPVTDQDGVLVGVIRQSKLRRFLDSRQILNGPGSGVGVILGVGELFSVTAGQLLSTLMSAAMSGGSAGAASEGHNDDRRR